MRRPNVRPKHVAVALFVAGVVATAAVQLSLAVQGVRDAAGRSADT